MIVIGIDPGTATTGYGVVCDDEAGNISLLDYGVITTAADLPTEQRLLIIYNKVMDLIKLHQPQSGAVEKLFFKRNVTNAISVGQARGVILLAFANAGVNFYEYAPTEIKSAVTGYGAADKKQIQLMVKVLLQLNEIPRPDDAADALAIAICHINSAEMNTLVKDFDHE